MAFARLWAGRAVRVQRQLYIQSELVRKCARQPCISAPFSFRCRPSRSVLFIFTDVTVSSLLAVDGVLTGKAANLRPEGRGEAAGWRQR